jgi:hypothetical protein
MGSSPDVQQVDVADDARSRRDADGGAAREPLHLPRGLRRLRVDDAARDRRRELIIVALVARPHAVWPIELRLGDEGPVGVVAHLVLLELDGVDPELGLVAERPALAQPEDLLARLRGELRELVGQGLALERRADSLLADVHPHATGSTRRRPGVVQAAALLVDAASLGVGEGAGVRASGGRLDRLLGAGDQEQRESGGREALHGLSMPRQRRGGNEREATSSARRPATDRTSACSRSSRSSRAARRPSPACSSDRR